VEFRGEKATIAEWGRKLGIKSQILYQRILTYGWSPERALTTPSGFRRRILEFSGKCAPVSDWAREVGIDKDIIYARLNAYGWTVQRALTEKPRVGKNQYG